MDNSPSQNQCPIWPSSLLQCHHQQQLNQDLTALSHGMVHATRLQWNRTNSGKEPKSFVPCGLQLSQNAKPTANMIYGLSTGPEFPHFSSHPLSPNLDSKTGYDISYNLFPDSAWYNGFPVSSLYSKKCGPHYPIINQSDLRAERANFLFPSKERHSAGAYPGGTGHLHNGINVSFDPGQLNTILSDCPRVFCSRTSGFLLLSSSSLLGVVCSCHNTHMSVLTFCEHSGVCNANPGYVVFMESGDTIAQWRNNYFGKFTIRVPGDHCEWDWPEGFSEITHIYISAIQETTISYNVSSQHLDYGHYRNGLLIPENPEVGLPVSKFLHSGHHWPSLETQNYVSRKSNSSTSFSNLYPVTNENGMGCLVSDGSALSNLVGLKEPHQVCHSTSDYKGSNFKLESSFICFSDLWNLKCHGENFEQPNVEGPPEDRDSFYSNCELNLGIPSEQSWTKGSKSLECNRTGAPYDSRSSVLENQQLKCMKINNKPLECALDDSHNATELNINCFPKLKEGENMKMFSAQDLTHWMTCDKMQDPIFSSTPSKTVSGSQKAHLTHWMSESGELAPFTGLEKSYNLSAISQEAGHTKTKKCQQLYDVYPPEQPLVRNITGVPTTFDSNVNCKLNYRSDRDFHGIGQWEDLEIEKKSRRKINHDSLEKFELSKRKRFHCAVPLSSEVDIGESNLDDSFSVTSSGDQANLSVQKEKPIVCHKYGIITNGRPTKQPKIVSMKNILIEATRASVSKRVKWNSSSTTRLKPISHGQSDKCTIYNFRSSMGARNSCRDVTLTGAEIPNLPLNEGNHDCICIYGSCADLPEQSHADDRTTGEKEDSTCSRVEGYKGRKGGSPRCSVSHCHDGDYRCHIPQDQLNVWLHIHANKSFPRGRLDSQKAEFVYESREEYARFKQSKGWKHLLVYKSIIHGLGLYTSRFIPRGSMVVEYVGEVVGPRVADRRESKYRFGRNKMMYKGACYLFKVDKGHIIDGTHKGGIARFVNHSCLPNCVAKVISVRNEKKVVFYADKDIYPGEEVTYDYRFNKEDEGEKIPCNCRSRNCKRYLN